jgi:hypothetical protein
MPRHPPVVLRTNRRPDTPNTSARMAS